MASKTIPFVVSTAFGEKLFTGVQKVLAAAKAPISLVKTDAKSAPADSKHLLAEPLCPISTGELANKYGLTSKVTSGRASKWYPNSIYPALNCEVVQNLYAQANPYFQAGTVPATKALAAKDEAAVKLQELQKERERAISSFFRDEATRHLVSTLRVAVEKASKIKADKKSVTIVTKPQGELTSVFDEILAQVTKSETDSKADELRASSTSLETSPIGNLWPKLVVFPENVHVVVAPPTPVGEQVTNLLVGMAGGTGMAAQQLVGGDAAVYTCANEEGNENPTGALLAASDLLAAVGCEAEAKRIVAALEKTYAARTIPKDLPGGSASLDAFVEAVAKNC